MHWKLFTDPQDWGHCMLDNVNSRKWSTLFYIPYVHICVSSQSLPLALETTHICDHLHQCCREGVMCTLILHSGCKAKITPQVERKKKMLREDLWEKPQKNVKHCEAAWMSKAVASTSPGISRSQGLSLSTVCHKLLTCDSLEKSSSIQWIGKDTQSPILSVLTVCLLNPLNTKFISLMVLCTLVPPSSTCISTLARS